MGNKLGRRRQVVEEKYTKPQGLYQHRDVDHKKLRKLILESKLAPCYPGDEDCTCELEECPICFLYYPTLNRSRCCLKSICTECFLQMKAPNSTRPTQCPFCKTSNYAVEYRGAKTKEEKGIEQIEEQRVIEAKIRMRQQEVQDDEERTQKRLYMSSSGRMTSTMDVECSSRAVQYSRIPVEAEEIVSAQDSCAATPVRQHLHSRQNRDDEFDLDLEDIMVMEAIWHSIQEKGWSRNPAQEDATPSSQYLAKNHYASSIPPRLAEPSSASSPSSSSPSGGFACAIAALAERQQMSNGGESSSTYNTYPRSNRITNWVEQDTDNYSSIRRSNEVDCGSEVAEAGTSYASSDSIQDGGGGNGGIVIPPLEGESAFFHNATNTGSIIPESFEEQMMLAMAVSLAEARVMPNAQGVAWN